MRWGEGGADGGGEGWDGVEATKNSISRMSTPTRVHINLHTHNREEAPPSDTHTVTPLPVVPPKPPPLPSEDCLRFNWCNYICIRLTHTHTHLSSFNRQDN